MRELKKEATAAGAKNLDRAEFKDKDGKALKKPAKKDASGKAKSADVMRKENEEFRKKKLEGDKKEFEKADAEYMKKVKEQKGKLQKAQRNCFRQIGRYVAGQMCLACDANWSKFLTKNSETSYTLKVATNTCVRLKTVCFDYLVERANSG